MRRGRKRERESGGMGGVVEVVEGGWGGDLAEARRVPSVERKGRALMGPIHHLGLYCTRPPRSPPPPSPRSEAQR